MKRLPQKLNLLLLLPGPLILILTEERSERREDTLLNELEWVVTCRQNFPDNHGTESQMNADWLQTLGPCLESPGIGLNWIVPPVSRRVSADKLFWLA